MLAQHIKRVRHTFVVFMHDLLMVPLAWLGAFWLRFNLDEIPPTFLESALITLVPVIVIQGVLNWRFQMYRGVWRFASLPDLLRIIKSVATGVLLIAVLAFALGKNILLPRSIPVLYGILLLLALAGPRALYRWLKDYRFATSDARRVLIVGAGKAGEMLLRDLLRGEKGDFFPVGLVDDSPRRQTQDLHGVPVLGNSEQIPTLVEQHSVDMIVLALPSASSKQRRRIVGFCDQTGLPIRTVPDLPSLMTGQVEINELREVAIEDLLGRDPVKLDWPLIRDGLQGRTVLVTGAGGSIGSELCRQLAGLEISRLVLFENGEFNLYQIERELVPQLHERLSCVLGDVRDTAALQKAFEQFRPDVVFHAAAYKHVPMLEDNIREAISNNVLGTANVAQAADRAGCGTFVLISTDKAVNPTNVMGASKRAAEIFCQNLNQRSQTRYVTVRFGNVLGSAGSVVPLFREQIRRGGPVTVTHPDMTRYFMTIPEASQLILEASVSGRGGEIFVLDMGEPVQISYLAEQMIRLAGRTPGEDIEITFTGLRPGEKLFEELFHHGEPLEQTNHAKLLLARYRDVNWEALSRVMQRFAQNTETMDVSALLSDLRELVPEYDLGRGTEQKSNVVTLDTAPRAN